MQVTLWRDDVALRHAVSAAHERHDRRSRLFLRLRHGGVDGFGEVAPQNGALNGDPSVLDVLDELSEVTIPQFLEVVSRESAVPSWTRIARFAAARPASCVAVALVEMALLDWELRSSDQDVRSLWPKNFDTPMMATVSLIDVEDSWDVDESAVRVRAKTSPGPVSGLALARVRQATLPMLLDFNCSARADEQVLNQVDALRGLADLVAVEQPYAAGNVIDHATLAPRLDVPISLDEGVRTPRDLDQIHRYGAARMVCIKPARVGGLANARTMVQRARDVGLTCYLGGFFESSFARHVHRLLAEHCVVEPSDLGDVATLEGLHRPEISWVDGGFGVAPSPEMLEKSTVLATWS
ncbi:MAG: enolase C-terminal domain-like protein [Acidimicrobiales bacterium]